jgi:hypothetical protein
MYLKLLFFCPPTGYLQTLLTKIYDQGICLIDCHTTLHSPHVPELPEDESVNNEQVQADVAYLPDFFYSNFGVFFCDEV